MWVYEPFLNFIGNVAELTCVGEIIIINNCVKDTPDHAALKHPKIKIQNMERNIFVNPAWNLGVELSIFDTVCILSDDVLVDLRVFIEADKFVSKDIGILGFGYHPVVYEFHAYKKFDLQEIDRYIITGDLKIKEAASDGIVEMTGNGCLFFLNKHNYIPVPKELLISGGDIWQYECQTILNRKTYYINHCFFYTPWNVTNNSGKVDQCIGDFSQENRETYLRLIQEFKAKLS
jgi:hypothetical protein